MSLLDRFLGRADPTPRAIIAPDPAPSRTDREKVAFHIDRFTRALEQCDKGPARRAELQANLDYWTALRDADAKLNGGE